MLKNELEAIHNKHLGGNILIANAKLNMAQYNLKPWFKRTRPMNRTDFRLIYDSIFDTDGAVLGKK